MLAGNAEGENMFETSKDVLYLVISFCIIWVTIFLCWVFYYLARILKNANQIVEEFRVRLQALSEAVDYIRGRVEQMSSLLTLVTEGASGLLKKVVAKKTEQWMNSGSAKVNEAAKEAVNRAMEATSKKMKKMAKAIKK